MATRESVATRLYRGEKSFGFIKHRRRWYAASGIVILVSIISLIFRGLTPSIDFKGGAQFTFAASGHTVSQVDSALGGLGIPDVQVTQVGTGSDAQIQVQTPVISQTGPGNETDKLVHALSTNLNVPSSKISSTSFGATWGSQITHKAIIGLVVFLIFVSIYLAIRFEWKMALAAMIALLHDLLVTAGIYSLVGFEVSPSTVIALLTILGYSLYDTVVVFDKVRENTSNIVGGNTITFSEATNLAVNQTLVRSINTSVIALLPVIGLLVIGAGLFGAGSLDDLSLALLIGLASGAYSSIFIASPLVTDLKEREPAFVQLRKRVATRRERDALAGRRSAAGLAGTESGAAALPAAGISLRPAGATAEGPAPGARPTNRPGRPGSPSRQRRNSRSKPKRKRR